MPFSGRKLHQRNPDGDSTGDTGSTRGPLELDENGLVRLNEDEDPYDAQGHLKHNVCLPAAIEQFPEPVIGMKGRRYGGLIIHIFVAVYMFIGLAIVCDDYFVPSLDMIAEGKHGAPPSRIRIGKISKYFMCFMYETKFQ